MEQAVASAVDTCIAENILKDFLLEQKAEVIAMSIYEYNEEYVKKTLHEDGYEEGKIDGITKGKAENLIANVEALMKNLGFDLAKACESLSITVTDYEDARKEI